MTSWRRPRPTCSAAATPPTSGQPLERFITVRNFEPTPDDASFVGEVIFRDTFGNLITNVNFEPSLRAIRPRTGPSRSPANGSRACRGPTATSPRARLMALAGSSGWVEIAVVNGDAARHLTAGAGTTVWLRRSLIGKPASCRGHPHRYTNVSHASIPPCTAPGRGVWKTSEA